MRWTLTRVVQHRCARSAAQFGSAQRNEHCHSAGAQPLGVAANAYRQHERCHDAAAPQNNRDCLRRVQA